MMWLFLGGLALVLMLITADRLANANPRILAQGVRWGSVAALAAASLFLLRTGRWAFFLLPAIQRLMRSLAGGGGGGSRFAGPWSSARPGTKESVVETPSVRMRLDHGSGSLDGEVLAGRNRGRRLGELAVAEVVALLDEFRATDAEAIRLLEAYLDRRDAEWRGLARESASGRREDHGPGGVMSREEAYAVLGLTPGAGADEVREAHHRLMKRLHPDQGGTTFLASKVNQAKDLLLRG